MNRLSKSKSPMWRRSMMDRLNLQDIVRDLEEISESGDYYGYEGESLGEYYTSTGPSLMSFPPVPVTCWTQSLDWKNTTERTSRAGMILPWR